MAHVWQRLQCTMPPVPESSVCPRRGLPLSGPSLLHSRGRSLARHAVAQCADQDTWDTWQSIRGPRAHIPSDLVPADCQTFPWLVHSSRLIHVGTCPFLSRPSYQRHVPCLSLNAAQCIALMTPWRRISCRVSVRQSEHSFFAAFHRLVYNYLRCPYWYTLDQKFKTSYRHFLYCHL